jgi:purine-nucleoside phosphorylase
MTSAVGSLDGEAFRTGDFCLITDHISLPGLSGLSPLLGAPSFVPMDHVNLLQGALPPTLKLTVPVRHPCIYVGLAGPQYETPAEVHMLRSWGGDVVGMSTTPEVIQAAACGLGVLAVALVTNVAGSRNVSHQDVLAVSSCKHDELQILMRQLIAFVSTRP